MQFLVAHADLVSPDRCEITLMTYGDRPPAHGRRDRTTRSAGGGFGSVPRGHRREVDALRGFNPSCCRAALRSLPDAMAYAISEALLTLLREHMPSAVIVNDEFQYLVAEVDPARPHQPLKIITTVSDDETCSARQLLDQAYNAATDFDSDTALQLPVRSQAAGETCGT
jgi:hypothetical protein